MNRKEALELLKECRAPKRLLEHCKTVSEHAKKIAEEKDADSEFVEVAGLLHDIGRTVTHSVRHGVAGAELMRSLGEEKIARVCETHIGAGLTKEEAVENGLPEKNFIPETLEEKIIAHADNETKGTKVVGLKQKSRGSELPEKARKRMQDLKKEVEDA